MDNYVSSVYKKILLESRLKYLSERLGKSIYYFDNMSEETIEKLYRQELLNEMTEENQKMGLYKENK